MGSNKMLANTGGMPMIRRTVSAIQPAVDALVVVTGRDSAEVERALGRLGVSTVFNPDFADGLSTSLKRGLAAVPSDADAVLVCLGDMPLVDTSIIRRLIAGFNPAEHRSICVPVHDGKRGNPVLWGKQHFGALMSLSGDKGGRGLFDLLADEIVEIPMPDGSVLTDIDTPEALTAMTAALSP
jgi:molybdenum cofactor cytidylyltransferase